MDLTVFEWVNKLTRYLIDEIVLQTICYDRGVDDWSETLYKELTVKQRELIEADVVVNAVMFSPSSTASHSQSHGSYQQMQGAQTDLFQKPKLSWAMQIYKKYGDPKFDELNTDRIRIINITDKI